MALTLALNYAVLKDIGWFFILFVAIGILQHLLMNVIYRNVFIRIGSVPIVGNFLNRPTVIMHELFGHLIPALLSGSSIVGLDLQEHRGQVSVRYEKNMFGMASVFIAGFGPTFFLPLIFVILVAYVGHYDIIQFIMVGDPIQKFYTVFIDIARMDEIKDLLLFYAAVIIAPGAASSMGDMRSILAFIRDSPFMVIVVGLATTFLMYISHVEGLKILNYGSIIITNTFAAFLVMYVFAILFLPLIVNGWAKRGYLWGTVAFGVVFSVAKLLFPTFDFPLVAGLIAANIAVLIKDLKTK